MHRGYVVTNKGTEDICKKEISELTAAKKIEKNATAITFDLKDYEELCKVVYRAQSIDRAVLMLAEFKVEKSMQDTIKNIDFEKISFPDFLENNFSASVECRREGEHDFQSVDIGTGVGKKLFAMLKDKKHFVETEYNNPDILFYLYIFEDKGYLGIDFSGIELAKRQYKIYNHPESLKAITAYALVRESGYDGSQVLLDPFMGSGVVVIEAALFACNYPVRYYDKDKLAFSKMKFFDRKFFEKEDSKIKNKKLELYGYDFLLKYLKASQKNAKLSGIFKFINLSKVDIEWLDIKFDRDTIDLIVSEPPLLSKYRDNKKIQKIYKELFYQGEFVLRGKRKMVLLTKHLDELEQEAKKYKFKLDKNKTIYQGKEKFEIAFFSKL